MSVILFKMRLLTQERERGKCPYCGCKGVSIASPYDKLALFIVICSVCRKQTAAYTKKEDAIRDWVKYKILDTL